MIKRITPAELSQVKEIYEYARQFMRENGNPNQWGESRPSMEMVEKNILDGDLYGVYEENILQGVFFFKEMQDKTYERNRYGRG